MTCSNCGGESDTDPCSACAPPPPATLKIGSIIGDRYELIRPLGSGGMGTVYAAHELKVLRADPDAGSEMALRFRSEIKLARQVRHKNVAGIHDYGEHGSLRYLSMQFVEGVDLKKILTERGPLPEREAFDAALQLADALEAIHGLGIVHRDLKTANVMRDSRGLIRLIDFGIAKRLGDQAALVQTAAGHVIGTPEYMSPEQASGEQVDLTSDIYSLGVVIFEIFTGHVPFQGETPVATVLKHLTQPPPLHGPEAKEIPPALVGVLSKALAKKPGDRYPSARALLQALREARQSAFSTGSQAVTTGMAVPTLAGATKIMGLQAPETNLGSEPTFTSPPRPPSLAEPSPPLPPSLAQTEPVAGSQLTAKVGLLLAFVVLSVGAAVTSVYFVIRAVWPVETVPEGPSITRAESEASPGVPAAVERLRPQTGPTTTETVEAGVAAVATPRAPAEVREPASRTAPRQDQRVSAITAEAVDATEPPPAEAPGQLQLAVKPWAEVSVDEAPVGTTPVKPIELAPGTHLVRLVHPGFRPLIRKVVIEPGETTRLEIDLTWEAVPLPPS